MDFLAQVQAHFAFLESAGFRLHDHEKASSFDNAYATFRAARLIVGVARERGQCYFEVGVPGTTRYDGQLLAELVGDAEGLKVSTQQRPSLSELAKALQRQLPALEAAFSPAQLEATQQELKRLGDARAERLFGRPSTGL